jgi:hypothetical protein
MSKTKVTATVHVTASSGDDKQRPEPARVQRAADSLRGMGFHVVRAGRFGVSVQGDRQRFEEELGIAPGQTAGTGIVISPRDRALTGLIDYVDILPPASLANE